VEATVSQARETSKADAGLWTIDYTVVKQDGSTVMTFSSSFLIKRR
jgi:itaconyl-CoA hydratase